MRKFVFALGITALSSSAFAGNEEIVGTWKLVSSQRKIVATGATVDTYGANPRGWIMYGPDNRVMVLILRSDRPKPESLDKMTDQQRADLFRSMLAYTGTFKFEGGSIEHHVDGAWNEVWTGRLIKNTAKKDGDRVVYTTPPVPFSGDGSISITTLTWERMK